MENTGSRVIDQLSSLDDVNISAPTNGQVISYDSVSGKWINSTISTSGGPAIMGTAGRIVTIGSGGNTLADSGHTLAEYATDSSLQSVYNELLSHEADTDNPHGVTAAQVGAISAVDGTAPIVSSTTSGTATVSINAASGSAAGSMSAAHFTLVNSATTAATSNTLIQRDGTGGFHSGAIFIEGVSATGYLQCNGKASGASIIVKPNSSNSGPQLQIRNDADSADVFTVDKDGNVKSAVIVASADSTSGGGQLAACGANTNKQLLVNYDTDSDQGEIQAIYQGVGVKPLNLQPFGGGLVVGTVDTNCDCEVTGGLTVDQDLTVSASSNLNGDVIIGGKLYATGGIDPPYLMLDVQTKESIATLGEAIAAEKKTGLMIWWDGTNHKGYQPSSGKYFTIAMTEDQGA